MRRTLGIVTGQGSPDTRTRGFDECIGQSHVRLEDDHTASARRTPLDHGQIETGLATVLGHGALPAGQMTVQPSFESAHAGRIVLACPRSGHGAKVGERRLWVRQAKRHNPFFDVNHALMLAKGHSIEQGFDRAHTMSVSRLGLEQHGTSARSCRHHHEIGLQVTSVLEMDAAVLNGDDLGVGFDGHTRLVECCEDPANEVCPPGMKEQTLSHVQGFSAGAKRAMNGRKAPPCQKPSGFDRRFIGGRG